MPPAETKTNSPAQPLELKDIVQYCESNFDKPLTTKQLATRSFLSQSHFARTFTQTVGMPPATYIRQLRFARAQTLLSTTNLKIEEIAKACGMIDAARFSRAFRGMFGMTPSAYRRTHGKGEV